jgi:stringent starvation protein B
MASKTQSTKPYLIRALHQWCTDFGFTPFLAVFVDDQVEVPMGFVKNNEIVLNISSAACHQLHIENDWISFQARFGGVPKKVLVPVTHVLAIYARENGQGMSFTFDTEVSHSSSIGKKIDTAQKREKKPALRIIK